MPLTKCKWKIPLHSSFTFKHFKNFKANTYTPMLWIWTSERIPMISILPHYLKVIKSNQFKSIDTE